MHKQTTPPRYNGMPFRLATVVACCILSTCFSCFATRCFAQEPNEDIQDVQKRIKEAEREKSRFKQLETLTEQRLKLLRELKTHYESIAQAESKLEDADDDDRKIERLERSIEEAEVGAERTNLRLEMLERRTALVELKFELTPTQNKLRTESQALSKMLDAGDKIVNRFSDALLKGDDDTAEEMEREFIQFERVFERRREILQLRFELTRARADGDEQWIRELQTELKELGAEDSAKPKPRQKPVDNLPVPMELSKDQITLAARMPFETEILPKLKAACFECHNQDTASGDLDLSRLVAQRPLVLNRSHWLNVIEQHKVRSMPPADAEQPSDDDRRAMLGWLTNAIENFDYRSIRRAGFVPAKRLTHDEYNNTVRDLVGIDIRPADRFPTDLSASSGFKNSANSLFIQPVTFERYVGAAEAIAQAAWPLAPKSKQQEQAIARLYGNSTSFYSSKTASRILRNFASRAYRRPLEDVELAALMRHFEARRRKGDSPEMALREVLQVVLISPNFLIRAEASPIKDGQAERVSDWELASRLSYFLWASMPDDKLFELASEGRLHQPDVLAQQVDRMLDDPRAETLGSLFAAQWLGFEALDRLQRDQIDNPWATDSLVEAMHNESSMLFHSLVQKNASIDRLLDADYTFINEELAKHYGIRGVRGSEMREVSLRETPRRGVLGHASILATTSFPRRTSPVLRGNWILTTLLGTPPPPPPPNVSEFDDRVAENERLTQRQKLEMHRSNARCYACHSQIDPLGFALEEFEWFGRYRPQRRGRPVDSVGKLPNGTEFQGLAGLSSTLLSERSSDLAEQLTRKLLAYGLGRQLESYDEATVRELKSEFEDDDRRLRSLIQAIVRSDTFQKKQR